MRVHPRSRARGFTLIEVLLALLLLGLLMAGAYAAIRNATAAVGSGQALAERTNKIRVTHAFIRRQLSTALASAYEVNRSSGVRYVIEGERDEITFVSPMPGYLGRGGPYVQRLGFRNEGGLLRLEFRHARLNGWDPDDGFDDRAAPPVVLLERVRSARFEYRGIDEQGRMGPWRPSWDRREALPALVRLNIEFDRDERMQWPELVVPLVVDPSAAFVANEPSFFTR